MKERVYKSSIVTIIVVAIVAAFTFAMTAFSPKVLAEENVNSNVSAYKGQSIDKVKEIDPHYPDAPVSDVYTLTVPSLDDRLTFGKDKNHKDIGTIFAPYTKKTMESDSIQQAKNNGLHDVQKVFGFENTDYGKINDSGLCWAASDSNLVAWYLDSMEEANYHPELLDGKVRDVNEIFYQFKNVWGYAPPINPNTGKEDVPANQASGVHGYDPTFGLSWYFTGRLADNKTPFSKNPNTSGAFLSDLPYQSYSAWLDQGKNSNNEILYGSWDYNNRRAIMPLAASADGKDGTAGNLSTLKNFSKTIVQQLHYGPTTIGVTKSNGNTNFAHAVTLWGADYDIHTGMVTKIYLTDSDDPYDKFIREVDISAKGYDANGIAMEYNGHHRGGGDPGAFKSINLSAVLYAPGAVQPKNEPGENVSGGGSGNHGSGGSHYVPDDGIEQVWAPESVKCDANGNVAIIKQPSETRVLEYGYATNDHDIPTNWQSSNIFNNLEMGKPYWFYMRVAATDTSPAGGMSDSYKFTPKQTDGVLPPPVQNKVNVRVVNGISQYTNNVKVGERITVVAEDKAGYTFSHWEIDEVYKSGSKSYTFPADRDMTVKAIYTQNAPVIPEPSEPEVTPSPKPTPKPNPSEDKIDWAPIVPGESIQPDIQPNPSEDRIDLIPIVPGESVEQDINTPDNADNQEQSQKPNGEESISQDNSLSSGAVAGIAVGSVAGVGAIGVGVFFLIKLLRRSL